MPESNPKFSESRNLFPMEEMLPEDFVHRKLNIGIPKEIGKHEQRTVLTPDAAKQLTKDGHKIYIEEGIGNGCAWPDSQYNHAGCIIEDRNTVFKQEIIAKVSPFCEDDINRLSKGQMLLSALHASSQTASDIKKLMAKRVTAIGFELILDDNNYAPFLHPISEISGILAVSEASKYLSTAVNGKGILLGGITGIPAAEVVILGAGTAAATAARAAIGMRANVKVFDSDMQRLYRFRHEVSDKVHTFFMKKSLLTEHLKTADLVIGAAPINSLQEQSAVTEDMLMKMKKNSVIIDLNADNVSCFASSRPTDAGSPVFKTHGVIHYCVPNIASLVPNTASEVFSNALTPILNELATVKYSSSIITKENAVKNGTYIYNGILTNELLGKKFGFPFSDINLIASVF
jgi:alanine dehydrogenase